MPTSWRNCLQPWGRAQQTRRVDAPGLADARARRLRCGVDSVPAAAGQRARRRGAGISSSPSRRCCSLLSSCSGRPRPCSVLDVERPVCSRRRSPSARCLAEPSGTRGAGCGPALRRCCSSSRHSSIVPLLLAVMTAALTSRTIEARSIYDARLTDEQVEERLRRRVLPRSDGPARRRSHTRPLRRRPNATAAKRR